MATTIYIAVSGSYSDYSIDGVFSTRELAEAYNREEGKYEADVEEWTLDEWAGAKRVDICAVRIHRDDGHVLRHNMGGSEVWQKGQRARYNINGPGADPVAYPATVTAWSSVSPEHALKVAVERRQAYLRGQTEANGVITEEAETRPEGDSIE